MGKNSIIGAVVGFALGAVTMGAGFVFGATLFGSMASGALIGASIGAALTKPQVPQYTAPVGGGFASFASTSETYGWSQLGTVFDILGKPIPVVFGTQRVGGRRIQEYARKIGEDDYLYLLYALSEGPIEDVTDIEINGLPVTDYGDVETFIQHGEDGEALVAPNPFAGQTVVSTNNYHRITTDWLAVDLPNTPDRLRLRFLFPNGIHRSALDSYTSQQGTLPGRVELEIAHADGVTLYNNYNGEAFFTIEKYSPSQYYYDLCTNDDDSTYVNREGLPTAGENKIYIRRRTAEVALTGTDSDRIDLFSTSEINYADQQYPNVATLGLRIKATAQLNNSSPEVTALVKGVKCDPSGGPKVWSDNPAWAVRELLVNTRFGVGNDIAAAMLDESSFTTSAAFCNELVHSGRTVGGVSVTEKRHRINGCIDGFERVNDLLLNICNLFSLNLIWLDSKVKLIPYDTVSTRAQLFTPGNARNFKWSWGSRTKKYGTVEIQFQDAALNYEKRTLTVTDDAANHNQQKISGYLITIDSQAVRLAARTAVQARLCDKAVEFEALLDAVHCQPGDRIGIAHPQLVGGVDTALLSGRLVGWGEGYVLLDSERTFTASTIYKVLFVLEDGTMQEANVVFGATITTAAVPISVSFITLGKEPRRNSPYALGPTLNEIEDYLVVRIGKSAAGELKVSAIKYDADVYVDDATDYMSTYTTAFYDSIATTPVVREIVDVVVRETVIEAADGSFSSTVTCYWTYPPNSGIQPRARVWFNNDYTNFPDNWIVLGEFSGTSAEVAGVVPGRTVAFKVQYLEYTYLTRYDV